MIREVAGLRIAALCAKRPSYIPRSGRSTGSRAQGLAYEKKVGRLLRRRWPDLRSAQWFEFRDRNGPGACQTDHYQVFDDQILLLECKLTETPVAFIQIDLLYRPVLEEIYRRPVTGVQVCKHLIQRDPRMIEDIGQALRRPGDNFVWHCVI